MATTPLPPWKDVELIRLYLDIFPELINMTSEELGLPPGLTLNHPMYHKQQSTLFPSSSTTVDSSTANVASRTTNEQQREAIFTRFVSASTYGYKEPTTPSNVINRQSTASLSLEDNFLSTLLADKLISTTEVHTRNISPIIFNSTVSNNIFKTTVPRLTTPLPTDNVTTISNTHATTSNNSPATVPRYQNITVSPLFSKSENNMTTTAKAFEFTTQVKSTDGMSIENTTPSQLLNTATQNVFTTTSISTTSPAYTSSSTTTLSSSGDDHTDYIEITTSPIAPSGEYFISTNTYLMGTKFESSTDGEGIDHTTSAGTNNKLLYTATEGSGDFDSTTTHYYESPSANANNEDAIEASSCLDCTTENIVNDETSSQETTITTLSTTKFADFSSKKIALTTQSTESFTIILNSFRKITTSPLLTSNVIPKQTLKPVEINEVTVENKFSSIPPITKMLNRLTSELHESTVYQTTTSSSATTTVPLYSTPKSATAPTHPIKNSKTSMASFHDHLFPYIPSSYLVSVMLLLTTGVEISSQKFVKNLEKNIAEMFVTAKQKNLDNLAIIESSRKRRSVKPSTEV